jgi:hypothetical protein
MPIAVAMIAKKKMARQNKMKNLASLLSISDLLQVLSFNDDRLIQMRTVVRYDREDPIPNFRRGRAVAVQVVLDQILLAQPADWCLAALMPQCFFN